MDNEKILVSDGNRIRDLYQIGRMTNHRANWFHVTCCILHGSEMSKVLRGGKERKMINFKLGIEIEKMKYSPCHKHGTKSP